MAIFKADYTQFQSFIDDISKIIAGLEGHAKVEDIRLLNKLVDNFKLKTEDFYREDRKLNIGVMGQVKSGKSSFLNTLLFDGKEILPKAATPKTATLTKIEYAEKNIIQVEYYSEEDWQELEETAKINFEEEVFNSARYLVDKAKTNGVDAKKYLKKGFAEIEFSTYDELAAELNNYVGEDGKFTPIVKAVTLHLNREELKGLSIVDTPGLNDPIASRTQRTKEFMEVCDVVFFLSQSGSFLDKTDWELLSTQLPQKGVKRLILIASKYDSGAVDVLRVHQEDDILGEDESTTDNIPKACEMISKKLRKIAKRRTEEFVVNLQERERTPELIDVVKQCATPVMVSAIACNMIGKKETDYSSEEKIIYANLKPFSSDWHSDLQQLSNFDKVRSMFAEAVDEKAKLLEEKAKCFIPNAQEEARGLLQSFLTKTTKRIQLLENNDQEQLNEQKSFVEKQSGNIKADIASVFGELNAKLEASKTEGTHELREASKDYLNVRERTGSITRSYTTTSGHLWWKKTHVGHYEEHYSYCIAADAIENLQKYAIEATNNVENVFTDSIQIKEIKRKLLDVVIKNFDLGSEKFDSSLFKIMMEEKVSAIEFPVFNIDLTEAMNGIATKFEGEIKSASQKNELSVALYKAISKIYDVLCNELVVSVTAFKKDMSEIKDKVQESLLTNITEELEALRVQCDNKEKEIAAYKEYATILQKNIDGLH